MYIDAECDEYEYGLEFKFDYEGERYSAIERIYPNGNVDIEVSNNLYPLEPIPDLVQDEAERILEELNNEGNR